MVEGGQRNEVLLLAEWSNGEINCIHRCHANRNGKRQIEIVDLTVDVVSQDGVFSFASDVLSTKLETSKHVLYKFNITLKKELSSGGSCIVGGVFHNKRWYGIFENNFQHCPPTAKIFTGP